MTDDDGVYLSRKLDDGSIIEFEERTSGFRAYFYTPAGGNRVRFPSVTTILGDVMPKGALLDWYEAQGAEAAATLAKKGALKGVDPTMAVEVTRAAGMSARETAKRAAKRGIAVHAILQRYAESGEVPNPSDYPADYRGYIRGLIKWLLHADPVPSAVERLVAHPEQGYAGRMDLRASIRARDTVVDLKTNRRCVIYREAALQVTGYAYGDMACGAPAPDQLLLVAVGPDGSFAEAQPGYGTDAAWHEALRFYRTLKAMQEVAEVPA
jgi:hypothetical protein